VLEGTVEHSCKRFAPEEPKAHTVTVNCQQRSKSMQLFSTISWIIRIKLGVPLTKLSLFLCAVMSTVASQLFSKRQ
jgi:hypothetical protein